MTSSVALSNRYIEAHNRQDLEGLLALVDDAVEFKRAGDSPLRGKSAVRQQYEDDWADHRSVLVTIKRIFEADRSVTIEIHVDSGPPSNVHYGGVVVHDWNEQGHLVRYRLYVDEVTPADECTAG